MFKISLRSPPRQQTLKCEFGSLGEVLRRAALWWLFSMISWLSSSLNQKSDHAVGDSNLNTSQYSLFLLTFSGSRSTAWFSHKLQSRGASAWKKLMIVCTSHYLLSLAALQCCVEILRCSIRLYTSFHYASLSNFCDQIRVTISFGNIFELWYVYMEKIISV